MYPTEIDAPNLAAQERTDCSVDVEREPQGVGDEVACPGGDNSDRHTCAFERVQHAHHRSIAAEREDGIDIRRSFGGEARGIAGRQDLTQIDLTTGAC